MSSDTIQHPIRDQEIRVYQAPEKQDGPKWIAIFGDGNSFPIRFSADTEEEVREKAEVFRSIVLAKNEAKYIARVGAMKKARAQKSQLKMAGKGN